MRLVRFALLMLLLAAPAWAAESAAVHSARVTATLVSDTDRVEPGKPLHIALRLLLAPGWHTYWQNPGDAGAPPEVTLTVSEGASAGPIAWPVPIRLPEGPLMTYGYTGEVVLPMSVTPGTGPLRVEAAATWLVCERICVPEEGHFSLELPPGTVAPSAEAAVIQAGLAKVPRPSPFSAQVAPDGTLSLAGDGLGAVKEAWFFPAGWGVIDGLAPQTLTVAPGRMSLALKRGSGFKADARLAGVVVLRDADGQETGLTVDAAPGPAVLSSAEPFWQVLLFALLGGLILNLMPCVFPVLAMKAMALARLSGQARGPVRAHAASYTAGVLVAFAGLGAALLVAKAAGAAVGWGFQFQSPVFVALTAWLLLLLGLNLSGVFAIDARLAGAGQGLASRGGHVGSFFTGLLAAVVATPCTAPFMGAAIAAALAAPAWLTMLVFLVMGLGLAAPYALLAVVPGLARLLPRPGRWMDVLRGALAFPMYAAAVWLLWVASVQSGPGGVLLVGAGGVVLGFGAWALGLTQRSGGRAWGRAAALLSVLGAALLPLVVTGGPPAQAEATERFSPARLDTLRAEGRPVFVNMTAAWCVTCLVNERIALSPERVREAFARHQVAYLKGDWTGGDASITAFLRAHERDGVPLYLLYPPGNAAPHVLPQSLTETEVLAQLDGLGRSAQADLDLARAASGKPVAPGIGDALP